MLKTDISIKILNIMCHQIRAPGQVGPNGSQSVPSSGVPTARLRPGPVRVRVTSRNDAMTLTPAGTPAVTVPAGLSPGRPGARPRVTVANSGLF
jgi:hypothetical protein